MNKYISAQLTREVVHSEEDVLFVGKIVSDESDRESEEERSSFRV